MRPCLSLSLKTALPALPRATAAQEALNKHHKPDGVGIFMDVATYIKKEFDLAYPSDGKVRARRAAAPPRRRAPLEPVQGAGQQEGCRQSRVPCWLWAGQRRPSAGVQRESARRID